MRILFFVHASQMCLFCTSLCAQDLQLEARASAESFPPPLQAVTMTWSSSTASLSESRDELSRLYISLNEISQLETVPAEMLPDDKTITDVMIRQGSWPAWHPSVDAQLEKVLCERNVLAGNCRFVGGSDQLKWLAGPGDMLDVPNYTFTESYRTRVVPSTELTSGYVAAKASDWETFRCGLDPTLPCPSTPVTDRTTAKQPLPLVLTKTALGSAGALPDDLQAGLDGILSENSDRRVVAYPELHLAQPLTVPLTGRNAPSEADFLKFRQNISPNALFVEGLQFESTTSEATSDPFLNDSVKLIERAMGFRETDNSVVPLNIEKGAQDKEIVIIHLDQKVDFTHCFFDQYLDHAAIYDLSKIGFAVVSLPDVLLKSNEHPCNMKILDGETPYAHHGTHTLGTFLRFMNLPDFHEQSAPDQKYSFAADNTRIFHFPLLERNFSLECPSCLIDLLSSFAAWNEIRMIDTIVVISASWDQLNADKIEEQFRNMKNVTFIVAAPSGEGDEKCVRHPAAMDDGQGRALDNVISVVALDLDSTQGTEGYRLVKFKEGLGSYGSCHDIGAIGVQLGPTNGDKLAIRKGSSQATPVIAAAVVNILRLAPEPLSPKQLTARLIATAEPPETSLPAAQGRLINFVDASRFQESAIIVQADGNKCEYFGEFDAIVPKGSASLPLKEIAGRKPIELNRSSLLRLHRREDRTFWAVFQDSRDNLVTGNFDMGDSVQENRWIEFNVQRVAPGNPSSCQSNLESVQFPVSDVVDLFFNRI